MIHQKKLRFFFSFVCILFALNIQAQYKTATSLLNWSEITELPAPPGETEQPGVAGHFVGISNDALVIAGGANFPKPVWETQKVYHNQREFHWKPKKMEYGI